MQTEIKILTEALNEQHCSDFVQTPESGGVVVFVGTVRNHTKGKAVLKLDFEAYEPMAVSEMTKIALKCGELWPVQRMAIHHRVGSLAIGDIAVIIAVSCAHRKAAFEACAFAIDTLKETVPIWKKEFFEDGDVWVAAHP
jgi:molybdopterin synthase catalytic subunit